MTPQSEERLDAALAFLATQLQSRLQVPDAQAELGAALLALFRSMVLHAEGIRVLCATPFTDASFANVRAMFEAWLQIRYICIATAPVIDAVKYKAFAILEVCDVAVDLGLDSQDLSAARAELQLLRTRFPDAVREVESLRSGHLGGSRFYWSGLGPTAMVRRVGAKLNGSPQLARLYKYLSWDAHQVLNSALESRVVEADSEVRMEFGPRQPRQEASAFVAGLAHTMLGDAWATMAKRFNWILP